MMALIKKTRVDDEVVTFYFNEVPWREAYRGIVPDAHLDRLADQKKDTQIFRSFGVPVHHILSAYVDKRFIGLICFHPTVDETETESVWEVGTLHTLPEYREKGIGEMLTRDMLMMLRKKQISRCIVWVLPDDHHKRSLYESVGFTDSGIKRTLTNATKDDSDHIKYVCSPLES